MTEVGGSLTVEAEGETEYLQTDEWLAENE